MLLKKIRNFSFKKMLAVILAVCISLTLIQSTMFLSMAGTSEKQMLRLTPTADGAKLGIKVSYDALSAGEYIVQFKYKFTSGQLHNNFNDASSSAGAVFAVYSQLASGGNGAASTPIICTGWVDACTKTDLNANTVQYAFTITESHLSANLAAGKKNFFVGFYAPKSADFYIADMVMYRKDDTTKTNVLPDYLKGENWRYGFWLNQGFEGSGGSKNYDAALIGDNQMLNLKLNASVAQKIGIKVNKAQITAGNYTVQFKYKFTKGELATAYSGSAADSVTFAVYNNRKSTALQATMQYVVSDLGAGSKYSFNQLNSNTISYTFNITNSDINNCEDDYFYIGFFVNGAPEFYLADMVMYKSDDASMTNLLPTSPNASDWKYGTYQSFYNGFTQIAGSKYVQYDETIFPKDKKILHLEGGGYQTGIKVDPAKITVGNTYTVRFDYNFKQGSFNYDFETHIQTGWKNLSDVVTFNFFHDRKRDTYDRMFAIVRKSGSGNDGSTYAVNQIDNNTVEFTFKVIDEMTHTSANGSYYLGFWVSQGDIDLYVGNMVMYDTSDTEQTNILPDEIIDNWAYMNIGSAGLGGEGWDTVKSGVSSNGELLPYDEELLIPEDKGKQILHLEGGAYQTGIKVDPAKITVGNTYTVRFDYNFKQGSFNYDFETHLQSGWKNLSDVVTFNFFHDRKRENIDTYERMFAIVRKGGSGKDGSTYAVNQIDNNTVEFTFKVIDEMTHTSANGSYYLGFWVSQGDIDLYVGNMVMYDTSDTEQTNILPSEIVDNWAYMNIGSAGLGGEGYDTVKSGVSSNGELLPYDEELLIPEDKGKQMLHFEGGAYQTGIKVDPAKITVGNTYKVRFSFNAKKGGFKYDFETHLQSGWKDLSDVVTFNFFHDRKRENITTYERMFAIVRKGGSGKDGSTYAVNQIDSSTLEFTFKINDEMSYTGAGGSYYLGFWFSRGDIDLYIADMLMYDANDATQTNILPEIFETNWVYMNIGSAGLGGEGWDTVKSGVSSNGELLPYDESLFPKTPIPKIEKMLRVTTSQNQSFLAVALEEGTIKPGVDYTIAFKYHAENYDIDQVVSCGVFYYDKNKTNGSAITSVAKLNSMKQGIVVDSSFSKRYKDGAYAEYTFNLDAAMLEIYNNKLFVGFSLGTSEEEQRLAYIYDFKIFKTSDKKKTNLLKMDTYSDDVDVWLGNWGLHRMNEIRKYVDYDASLFVPTSEENLYVDYTFNGDDGEWWKPGDFETDSSDKITVETATIKGRVIDQNGKPIANAKFVLKGTNNVFTTKSDANGYYIFSNVPVDLYELYIIDGQNREIFTGFSNFFSNGDTATVNITCDSSKAVYIDEQVVTGSVKGNVYTPDLKTVSNIKIYLRNFGEITTDSEGYFEFTDIPAGDYELYTILEDGSEYVFRTVSVKENVELAVKLKYDVSDVSAEESNNNSWLIWVIVAAGVVLVLGGGTALLIILKRKRQNN